MRLPRDLSGKELAQALKVLGYTDVAAHFELGREVLLARLFGAER